MMNEQNNILFDLYKKVYALNRNDKEYLFDNIDNIMTEIKTAESENIIKTASGIHDPETIEDLKHLIEKMEKYISIDNDLSLDSLSVLFIHYFPAQKSLF
jgi:hypothetical protein